MQRLLVEHQRQLEKTAFKVNRSHAVFLHPGSHDLLRVQPRNMLGIVAERAQNLIRMFA
ncbi:hypothetical protein P3T20_005714 [Paraburkholderia sp. GAS206C]|jgi:hypothetical protein|uniref:Uncharacterized protein n=1 Tax=Paraburkholderia phenazinium TaxID=60549 RepID=A0A1N6GZC1_9BURK|nr:hypothetical protein SAMN05444168_2840 [Paraburkholderia phenazinium]